MVKLADVVVVRFAAPLSLQAGHVFVDLGVDEDHGKGGYTSLDRRCAALHLQILPRGGYRGLVDLGAAADEVARLRAQ